MSVAFHRRPLPVGRRGFTLLELLVALVIIGILAAILVPAVQSSREAARRVECTSHLRQIGIAAHNYESTHGVFPGAHRLGAGQWQRQLLPFLEQPEDADTVPLYGCPSDSFGTGNIPKAQYSYHVNDGLWRVDANGFARSASRPRQTRARDVTDGLSNTAAFAEKLAWPDIAGHDLPPDSFQHYWIRRLRNTAAFHADMDAFADECRHRALPPGRSWFFTWGYNHIMPPNQNSCFNGPRSQPESTDYWAVTSTSEHPGGVNMLSADGAVRFVSDHIDVQVWRALGTRSLGEVEAGGAP